MIEVCFECHTPLKETDQVIKGDPTIFSGWGNDRKKGGGTDERVSGNRHLVENNTYHLVCFEKVKHEYQQTRKRGLGFSIILIVVILVIVFAIFIPMFFR